MREYGFSQTRILSQKDKMVDFVLMRESTGQWKPVFSHILCSVFHTLWCFKEFKMGTLARMGQLPLLLPKTTFNTPENIRKPYRFNYDFKEDKRRWYCKKTCFLILPNIIRERLYYDLQNFHLIGLKPLQNLLNLFWY